MLELLKDLWDFAREQRKFWIVPLVITLLVLGALVALAELSASSPVIYTLF